MPRKLLLILVVVFLCPAPSASAAPDPVAREAMALALHVETSRVVDAVAYPVEAVSATNRVVLGLYQGNGRWRFPALVLYHPCPAGSCLSVARLGAAVKRLEPVALIDLDADRNVLEAPQQAFDQPGGGIRRTSLKQPEKRARRPALAVVLDRDEGEDRTRVDLVLVALEGPGTFPVVAEIPVLRRSIEPRDGRPMPSTLRLGFAADRVVFERQGPVRRALVTSRAFLPRGSGCPAPRSEDHSWTFDRDRYREDPVPVPRIGDCP